MYYIGSKQYLLPFIDECINKIVPIEKSHMTFCDLFAGTGIVGTHFKKKGCKIIANDIQYYSYVLNKQYIENHKPLTFSGLCHIIPELTSFTKPVEKANCVCKYLSNIEGVDGFIYKNYCKGGTVGDEYERLYFTDENGKKCDAIRTVINQWLNDKIITENEYYFLLATLIENIDKVANTASVYGAFLKRIKRPAQKPLIMRPAEQIINSQEHDVYCKPANDLIKDIKADILYLDPPYNERQYSAYYHLLETIAKYDSPTLHGKTGLRDYSSQKSDFCVKSKVKEAFEDIILTADVKYIFLSYNNEGLMTFEEIENIMSKRGQYGRFEREYSRFKADKTGARNHKAESTIEYLHWVICK